MHNLIYYIYQSKIYSIILLHYMQRHNYHLTSFILYIHNYQLFLSIYIQFPHYPTNISPLFSINSKSLFFYISLYLLFQFIILLFHHLGILFISSITHRHSSIILQFSLLLLTYNILYQQYIYIQSLLCNLCALNINFVTVSQFPPVLRTFQLFHSLCITIKVGTPYISIKYQYYLELIG